MSARGGLGGLSAGLPGRSSSRSGVVGRASGGGSSSSGGGGGGGLH